MENKGKVPEEAICYWGKENPSLSVEIAYPPYFLGRMDFPPENRIFLITGMVGVDISGSCLGLYFFLKMN